MKSFFVFMSLVGLVVWARWPFLLNANEMNSDHALVGLQALELQREEWSWFLWGCDYQASFEPLLASLLFTIFGVSTSAILGVALLATLLILAIYWRTLAPTLGVARTWLVLLPLCVGSYYFIRGNLFPPRHWSVVTMIIGVWLLPIARRRRSLFLLELAGFLPFLALYIDFFAIQFFIPYFVYAFVALKEERRNHAFSIGAFIGAVLLAISRNLGPKAGAPLAFSPRRILDNFSLLFDTCLPRILGFDSAAWPEAWGRAVQILALLLYLAVLAMGLRFLWRRQFETALDGYALFAWLTVGQTVAGFLGSSMAADENAVRYLTPILYVWPWAVAPFVRYYRGFVPALGLIALLGGLHHWRVTQTLYPAGWNVQTARGKSADETRLAAWLREQGVALAYADYWDAYRLSFLFGENPPVTPDEPHRVRDPYPRPVRKPVAHLRGPGDRRPLPPGSQTAFGDYTAVVVQPGND